MKLKLCAEERKKLHPTMQLVLSRQEYVDALEQCIRPAFDRHERTALNVTAPGEQQELYLSLDPTLQLEMGMNHYRIYFSVASPRAGLLRTFISAPLYNPLGIHASDAEWKDAAKDVVRDFKTAYGLNYSPLIYRAGEMID